MEKILDIFQFRREFLTGTLTDATICPQGETIIKNFQLCMDQDSNPDFQRSNQTP